MPEDEEDLRIEALRQELMRRIETGESSLREDVRDVRSQIRLIRWLLGIAIAVSSVLVGLLAFIADII